MSLVSLPVEILVMILERCDPETLMECHQVNKIFRDICKKYVSCSFDQVLGRYWERNVFRTFHVIEKYFPHHTTPVWALEYFLRDEEEDLMCMTYKKLNP